MEVQLSSLTARISKGTERSEEEILKQLLKLEKNWVYTVGDWNWLTAERRVDLELPLLLNSVIDNVVVHVLSERKGTVECQCKDVAVEERTSSSLRLRVDSSSTCTDLSYTDSLQDALNVLFPCCTQRSMTSIGGKLCDASSTVLDCFVPGAVLSWTDPNNGNCFRGTLRANYKLTCTSRTFFLLHATDQGSC